MPWPEWMQAGSGRFVKENGIPINIANIAERFERALVGLNAIEVGENYPVISLKSNYGFSDLRDQDLSTGSGSVANTVGDGYYSITTGTTTGSVGRLDSVERGRYVAGTIAVPGQGVYLPQDLQGDEVARWGYFNDNNGFGSGLDANGLFFFRRFDGVEDVIRREDWDDPLDGSGKSGATLDLSRLQIFQWPFRWYGAGPIITQIGGPFAGPDMIDAFLYEGQDATPIVKDPNLQLRAEIDNGTGTRDIELRVFGRQFGIIGRYNPNRRITSETRINQSVGTTFVPLISFRQKVAYDSVSVKTSSVAFLVANADIIFQIRVAPTLTGASYAAPSNILANETALEFDISATAITGGQSIYTGLGDSGTGVNSVGAEKDIPEIDLPVNVDITLCARAITGTATVTSVFKAREEW